MLIIITPKEIGKFKSVDITQDDKRCQWDFPFCDVDELAKQWEDGEHYKFAIVLDDRLYECEVEWNDQRRNAREV